MRAVSQTSAPPSAGSRRRRCRRAASAISCTIESPSPAPPRPRASSARLNRSNARCEEGSSKPGPVVGHVQLDDAVPATRRRSVDLAGRRTASALSTRLSSACSSRTGSASTNSPSARPDPGPAPTPRARFAKRAATLVEAARASVGPLRAQRQRAVLRAREQQQIVRQPRQPLGLLERRAEREPRARRATAAAAARARARSAAARPACAARGSRLRRTGARARSAACSRVEHLVQRDREPRDLVAAPERPAVVPGEDAETPRRDGASPRPGAVPPRRARSPASDASRTRERAGDEQLAEDPVERLLAGCERARDDDRAAARHGHGEHAPFAVRLPQRDGRAGACRLQRSRTASRRSRSGGSAGWERLDRPSGRVDHLSERRPLAASGSTSPCSSCACATASVACALSVWSTDVEQRTADAHVDEHGHRCRSRTPSRAAKASVSRTRIGSDAHGVRAADSRSRAPSRSMSRADLVAEVAHVDVDRRSNGARTTCPTLRRAAGRE